MIRKVKYKLKSELPYNPDDVNIRLQHFRVSELIGMISKDSLDIWKNEDFKLIGKKPKEQINIWDQDDLQRNFGLWNKVQKSLFIESLLIKLPIPLFYFDGSIKPWRVIDGLQRLHTIISFVDTNNSDNFELNSLEYLADECNGKNFDELAGYLKARILNAELEGYVINPGTPPEVKYNIFKRINTGGLKLNGQEIRNAFCKGAPADFTKGLALETTFRKATNEKVPSRRMLDREYVTRFIAFQFFDYNDYFSKMDVFLSQAMLEIYSSDNKELKELKRLFLLSMSRAINIFGTKAFYRFESNGLLKGKPNKAVFDTMSWNLTKLSDKNYVKIFNSKSVFLKKYINFMNANSKFYKSVNDTTGSKKSVLNRFEELEKFIKDFIQ